MEVLLKHTGKLPDAVRLGQLHSSAAWGFEGRPTGSLEFAGGGMAAAVAASQADLASEGSGYSSKLAVRFGSEVPVAGTPRKDWQQQPSGCSIYVDGTAASNGEAGSLPFIRQGSMQQGAHQSCISAMAVCSAQLHVAGHAACSRPRSPQVLVHQAPGLAAASGEGQCSSVGELSFSGSGSVAGAQGSFSTMLAASGASFSPAMAAPGIRQLCQGNSSPSRSPRRADSPDSNSSSWVLSQPCKLCCPAQCKQSPQGDGLSSAPESIRCRLVGLADDDLQPKQHLQQPMQQLKLNSRYGSNQLGDPGHAPVPDRLQDHTGQLLQAINEYQLQGSASGVTELVTCQQHHMQQQQQQIYAALEYTGTVSMLPQDDDDEEVDEADPYADREAIQLTMLNGKSMRRLTPASSTAGEACAAAACPATAQQDWQHWQQQEQEQQGPHTTLAGPLRSLPLPQLSARQTRPPATARATSAPEQAIQAAAATAAVTGSLWHDLEPPLWSRQILAVFGSLAGALPSSHGPASAGRPTGSHMRQPGVPATHHFAETNSAMDGSKREQRPGSPVASQPETRFWTRTFTSHSVAHGAASARGSTSRSDGGASTASVFSISSSLAHVFGSVGGVIRTQAGPLHKGLRRTSLGHQIEQCTLQHQRSAEGKPGRLERQASKQLSTPIMVLDMGLHKLPGVTEAVQLVTVLPPGLEGRAHYMGALNTLQQHTPGYLVSVTQAAGCRW